MSMTKKRDRRDDETVVNEARSGGQRRELGNKAII